MFLGRCKAASQGGIDFLRREFAEAGHHKAFAEVAVGSQGRGRPPVHGSMTGQVDGVGEKGRGGIGHGGAPGQHRDRIGDAH